MKRIFKTWIILTLVTTCTSFAFAGKREKREAAKEAREYQEELAGLEKKKSRATFVTEGVSGTLVWKEYCPNPNATGNPSLVVVLGGKDSAAGGRKAPEPAEGLVPLLDWTRTKWKGGKVVVLVPQLQKPPMGIRGGRNVTSGMASSGADRIPILVRDRAEANGVAPDRVFATGFSMGGEAIWELLNSDSRLFSRAVLVGSGGDAGQIGDVRAEVLVFHGENDGTVSSAFARAMVEAVNARHPGRATLTILKGKDHKESAETAYSRRETWDWLLR